MLLALQPRHIHLPQLLHDCRLTGVPVVRPRPPAAKWRARLDVLPRCSTVAGRCEPSSSEPSSLRLCLFPPANSSARAAADAAPFEIEVVTPKRTWRLVAASDMECLAWMRVVSAAAGIPAEW